MSGQGAHVVRIPPPLYYALGFAAGMVLHTLAPLPIGGRPATAVAGAIVGLVGLVLVASGVSGVIRHHTTIVPHHPVTALVTTGAYRWSRNPMYTGLAILYLGGAFLAGSWWPVVLWPVLLLIVARLVIRPEEAYLTDRFGPAYADYRSRVRRWV